MQSFLEELHRRGMVHSTSDEQGLYSHLQTGVRRAYIGFDPTSDSLTVGNLLPLMALRLFQKCGHRPVVLCGGGTGLVGDPSGKSLERPLLSREEVENNIRGQMKVFSRILDFGADDGAILLNNLDWLGSLGYLQALRTAGKHLSVFSMFQKDSVQSRRDTGLSYAEFSYQFLQAYDFAHMHAQGDVTIQMGGSDQWGNITSGLDLIRKTSKTGTPAFGITFPLLLDNAGNKMGKSARGAIWMTPERTSPYELYQYYLNLSDEAASALLPRIILRPIDEVEEIALAAGRDPSARIAQRSLADEVTRLLHGDEARQLCESASRIMFGSSVRSLSLNELETVFQNVPTTLLTRNEVAVGMPAVELAVRTGLSNSKSDARRLIQGAGLSINGDVLGSQDVEIDREWLLHGKYLLIRRGAKTWHLVRVD